MPEFSRRLFVHHGIPIPLSAIGSSTQLHARKAASRTIGSPRFVAIGYTHEGQRPLLSGGTLLEVRFCISATTIAGKTATSLNYLRAKRLASTPPLHPVSNPVPSVTISLASCLTTLEAFHYEMNED